MNSFYRRLATALGITALSAIAGCASMPDGFYRQRNLVSDTAAIPAEHHDPQLVNSWGLAFNPFGVAWVADNGTGVSTLYDGNGIKQSLVVTIPGAAPGVQGRPTGIVFYGGPGFTVTQGTMTGPARFIFAGEDGVISAWAPNVNPTNAIRVFPPIGTSDSIYKGLALSASGTRPLLYATDFHNNRVDVFDTNFDRVTLPGTPFRDPHLPKGFAPFGIQAINGDLYVTYAMQDEEAEDDVPGPGLGFVSVFAPNGEFQRRLISRGQLNAPWGLAFAPESFGRFGSALLVGNFGDGRINAYDIDSGAFVGQLRGADHKPIQIDGLWGIQFGNGLQNQPTNTLFFASGPDDETHGLYGRLDVIDDHYVAATSKEK
ncbi:MAG: TIGR03118 family protein [Massilia sp.]